MKRKWLYLLSLVTVCCVCGNVCVAAEEKQTGNSAGDSVGRSAVNSTENSTEISTEKELPYLFKITDPDYPVYAASSYESNFVGTVQVEGVFTIVEEAEDEDGELWGKLKSGMGWINLTDTGMLDDKPVQAKFLTEAELENQKDYHKFVAEDSEYISWILFETEEELKDVKLELLEYEYMQGKYESSEVLYELAELDGEKPFIAGVVYWGDMTTYGISFKDVEEKEYFYALTVSGKDGSLIMEEYDPYAEWYVLETE